MNSSSHLLVEIFLLTVQILYFLAFIQIVEEVLDIDVHGISFLFSINYICVFCLVNIFVVFFPLILLSLAGN